jgi:hypothetical protein
LNTDWLFPYGEVEGGSKVIIYGAGDVGQSYYSQILLNKYCRIIHWVDKSYLAYREFGLDVESIDAILGSNYDYVVIAICDSFKAREINQILVNMGVLQEKIIWNSSERFTFKGTVYEKRIIDPAIMCAKKVLSRRCIGTGSGCGKEYLDSIVDKARNGFVIPRLVVELTSACTLKCKHCNNLIPYLNPRSIEIEKIKNNIGVIANAVDEIVIVELIGGEPLLYARLKEILEYLIGLDNVFEVEITTNGTIVPGKELLDCLKNSKVTLNISCYEASEKIQELERAAFDNGIRYVCLKDCEWIDSGDIRDRGRSDEQIRETYWKCGPSYICKTLFDEKIYACARSASLYQMDVIEDSNGYVEVDERE